MGGPPDINGKASMHLEYIRDIPNWNCLFSLLVFCSSRFYTYSKSGICERGELCHTIRKANYPIRFEITYLPGLKRFIRKPITAPGIPIRTQTSGAGMQIERKRRTGWLGRL
jgi:hypothetical protein